MALRAVVVGTSFGGRVHVPALRAAGFEVVGLVGSDEQRTADRASAFDIAEHGTSITDVVERASADVITVSTPPEAHHPSVMEAVGTGRHVLAEKPFALSVAEAEEMVAAAESSGVTAMVAFEFRWQPAEALIARSLRRGDIGVPQAATILSHSGLVASGLPSAFNDTWWADAAAGGGILNAAGVHVLDRLHTWLGPIASVSGDTRQVAALEGDAEDTYSALMRTADGVSVSMQHCSGAQGDRQSVNKVIGTEGTIWLDSDGAHLSNGTETVDLEVTPDLMPPPLPDYPSDDPRHAFTAFELPLFIRLAERFRDEITGAEIDPNMPPTPTFADGLATQRVIDGIRASSLAGGALQELNQVAQ